MALIYSYRKGAVILDIIKSLSEQFNTSPVYVKNIITLIDEGNTIPFIARYRKEMTGAMDDQVLRELADRLTYLRNLESRKAEVKASIEEQGKWSAELAAALDKAETLAEVEDIYRPYKPKRKTRASVAREKGLEPLAAAIMLQSPSFDPHAEAVKFINEEKGVSSAGEAVQGACDIIAEEISDNAELRKALREYLWKNGQIVVTSDCADDNVYAMYRDFSEPVHKIAGHRVLAIDRGERENVLKVKLVADKDQQIAMIDKAYVRNTSPSAALVKAAGEDALSRLIFPALEREIRGMLTDSAAEQAIKVFALNLKNLLMQPPVKGKNVLGVDPAYRTGCKLAVVDSTGKVLHTGVIYPTPPQNRVEEAAYTVKQLIKRFNITAIAIGNGTASRETEMFIADVLKSMDYPAAYMVVSEAGASVYSASKLAAEEFPDFDVSLRSAVSIARRLQDPLAELVKIDPKAIGVGQYQHDMPKARLEEALSGVVEACVNAVGVDVNTASYSLLSHVAGLSESVAKNVVAYRNAHGHFKSRRQLLQVPKLGQKAFQQCAGFLRVPESEDVLDNTAVHPESYEAAHRLAKLCGFSLSDLRSGQLEKLKSITEKEAKSLAEQIGVGVPTLLDIIDELQKPGRDPRESLPPPLLRKDLMKLEDLKPGMVVTGTVRNVIDFGVFVDIGVHEDGLVHISQLADKFVRHPSEVVKVGDIVNVRVLEVDIKRRRISLTMKGVRQKTQP